MPDPNDKGQNGGEAGAGGGNPPAGSEKTADQRLADMEANFTKMNSTLQSTQEELKRVNNLNGVLMQRLNSGGGNPPAGDGGGMDASRTTPIKLKRDFSKLDPSADPAGFAQELVLETAEQVSNVIAHSHRQQSEAASLRKAFYEKNKDLVGWERLVGTFSDEVQAANPGLTFDQSAEIIAQRAREFITSKGVTNTPGDAGEPPTILPPSKSGDHGASGPTIKPPKGGGSGEYNPDKAYEEDMKDYSGMRNKERDRTVIKPA